MADQKVSDLPSLNGVDVDPADLLYIVDSSAGTAGSKKITVGQFQVAPFSAGTANGVLYFDGSKVLTSGSALTFDGTNFATTGTATATKLVPTGNVTAGNGMYLPAANTLAWSTNGAEGMRLDSSGNLGLGVTPSAWSTNRKALQIGGTVAALGLAAQYSEIAHNAISTVSGPQYATSNPAAIVDFNNAAAGGFAWRIAPSGTAGNAISFTQAMTLTSGGELCVGTTAAATGARLTVNGVDSTSATFIVHFANSSTTRCFAVEGAGRILTGTAAESPYNNTTASAANVFVDSAGVLFRSTSSLKYKTDVQDATHGLAEVMQLRPVTYKGKNDGDTVFGGLIAEEVHAAGLTEFVQYAEDGSPDALAYGNMVALLTKAVQEQQAIINDLRARVAALEAK